MDLFNQSGAYFSSCRQYRYALWRIWRRDLPLLMVIGLNPSQANEQAEDPTIKSVVRLAAANGYGGVYMMNCFPCISTNSDFVNENNLEENNEWLERVAAQCKDVVFAWGNFEIVRELGRDKQMVATFKKAFCLGKNKNGSPKHPLYIKSTTKLLPFDS